MRRPQTKVVYDDNSDEEDDNLSYRSDEDELLDDSPSDLEEEALGNDSDYVEELPDDDDGGGGGDDGSYCTESSFRSHSTLGSTPGTFLLEACAVLLQTCLQCLKVVVSFFKPCAETKAHCSKWSLHSKTGLCLPSARLARALQNGRSSRSPCFLTLFKKHILLLFSDFFPPARVFKFACFRAFGDLRVRAVMYSVGSFIHPSFCTSVFIFNHE